MRETLAQLIACPRHSCFTLKNAQKFLPSKNEKNLCSTENFCAASPAIASGSCYWWIVLTNAVVARLQIPQTAVEHPWPIPGAYSLDPRKIYPACLAPWGQLFHVFVLSCSDSSGRSLPLPNRSCRSGL